MISTVQTSCRWGWRRAAAVFLIALGVYGFTAQRGVSWQDSGEYQWRVRQADYLSQGGSRSHPLYIAIGKTLSDLVGQDHDAHALNVFSGVMMAVGLAMFASVLGRLGVDARLITALVAAVGLSHVTWWLATVAEVYSLSGALLMVELYALIRLDQEKKGRWLILLALASGMHLSVHNFSLLTLPIYLIAAIQARPRLKTTVAAAVAWLAGASGYLTVAGIQIHSLGWSTGVADCLWGGHYYEQVFNVSEAGPQWGANWALMSLTFASIVLLFGGIGFYRCLRGKHGPIGRYLAIIAAIECLFLVRYSVPDQFTFALPTWLCVAVLAGIGIPSWIQRSDRWRRALPWLIGLAAICQPVVYHLAYTQARGRFDRPTHSAPRDEAAYWILPWKQNEQSAQHWIDAITQQLEPNAWIVTDNTAYYPLLCSGWKGRVFKTLPTMPEGAGHPLYWTTRFDLPDAWQVVETLPSLRLRRIEPMAEAKLDTSN